MYKSTLIQFIKTLNRKEMTRFVEFIGSPYFNKHRDVKVLVNYFNKIYPDFSKKKTDRKEIFSKVFKGESYSEAKLKHVFSYTLRNIETFLSLQEFMKVETDLNLYLLRDLRKRKLNKRFEKILNRTKDTITTEKHQNFDHHFRMYETTAEADLFFVDQATFRRDESLQFKVDSLDRFYLSEKLRSVCEMINRSHFLRREYDYNFVEETIKYLESNLEWWSTTPSITVYYQVYHTLTDKDNNRHYYKLTDLLAKYGDCFPEGERRDLYHYCLNFCIRRGNQGEHQFWSETLKIYKELLRNGLVIEEGVFKESHYRNIASAALRVKEYEWAKEFIFKYKNDVPERTRENTYNYNLARLYYHTQEYSEALGLLNTVEYTDPFFYRNSKSLLLRIYYDLGETDALNSLVESFKAYVSRDKLLNKGKLKRYSDHFRLTGRIYRLKMNYEYLPAVQFEKELSKLEEKVDSTGALAGKDWIKEKLKELRDKVK